MFLRVNYDAVYLHLSCASSGIWQFWQNDNISVGKMHICAATVDSGILGAAWGHVSLEILELGSIFLKYKLFLPSWNKWTHQGNDNVHSYSTCLNHFHKHCAYSWSPIYLYGVKEKEGWGWIRGRKADEEGNNRFVHFNMMWCRPVEFVLTAPAAKPQRLHQLPSGSSMHRHSPHLLVFPTIPWGHSISGQLVQTQFNLGHLKR